MYESAEEAKQKLEGSVVIYDGCPVFVTGATGGKGKVVLYYKSLPVGDRAVQKEAAIVDPLWDFRGIGTRLGYTSIKNLAHGFHDAVFVSRVPARHSRQGLDGKTVILNPFDPNIAGNYSWQDLITRDDSLTKTVQNLFMSSEVAFGLITDSPEVYRSIPFHRKMTLMYDRVSPPYLIYRNDKVGYTENGKTFKLAKHKDYLREELIDMVGLKIA